MNAVIALPDPIAERSGGLVSTDFWIKVGIPREFLPKLKALGKQFGAEKASSAYAARVIVLLGLLHPDEVDAMVLRAAEKLGPARKFYLDGTQWSGGDPRAN